VKKRKITTDSITANIETASTSVANNPESYLFRSLTTGVCYTLFLIASWCRADCHLSHCVSIKCGVDLIVMWCTGAWVHWL